MVDSINRLGDDLTIIQIAHRITTVQSCDNIIVLDRNRIAASGTYKALAASNVVFQGLAGV